MNKYKSEVLVGMFVVLTIGAVMLLALKVANQSVGGDGDTYTLYAKFDNIGGLKARSSVKVGGVNVGRVSSITLDQEDFTPVVELSILKSYDGFPETSSVSILTSGLLGEQYVGFQPGFSFDGVANLKDGDYLQDTKSALVLEDLIGQFLFSRGSDEE
ncbi:outer membrane lipid asymmetry maintenance protein MlaD [Alteromonas sp. KS69]|jgi:phospholipid/cholesterol/gamma-HCH transport system substrate-binding protein|uniref:Outer membrane lipid asymmetry maintenance protein MlaD n=2 Tax=Alteromonas TaxID=226 RepID=A0AAW7Z1C3_9ALTE|nr:MULTISPECIES: outer membrane lipid asymmetry maintenance protein MlaD [Alteromonas]AMJ89709.1 outer membrane lipid asymmetry maintenance protein MlaD [Alteromonas sp. Mac2]PHS58029.1 MAG: outer membrane lipid asymmetry maintenance protein MlaD [Alteromonas sp.]AEF04426.1 mce family protein [Alteromonas naphthalenivorans]ALM91730.1 putative ABC transporter, periplasmic component YrbD [Alteromonas stellipolaris LMG 21856]AMJ73408.1 outer membrane lipid asymmetry maintenance protein MlaD [Alte|tara:strand:+ start:324 stop:797 length:474 start_codon:yes stop_codon:yes gene_type:complete